MRLNKIEVKSVLHLNYFQTESSHMKFNKHLSYHIIFAFLLSSFQVAGQVNDRYNTSWNEHLDFPAFNYQNYSASSYQHYENTTQPPHPYFSTDQRTSNLKEVEDAISRLRSNSPDAVTHAHYIIHNNNPASSLLPLRMELASFLYNIKRYQEAEEVYNEVNVDQLNELEYSEYLFKKGYSHFVRKDIRMADQLFAQTIDFRNQFYYPSNYYYGMTRYFEDDFDKAVNHFKIVANTSVYGEFIPYYLSQIYFAQEDYDRLISYGEQKISLENTKNKKEIRLLLGQAYYIRGDYERALKHLEYYEANTEKLTVDEFYQLAFTQYQTGKFDKAKDNFLELTNQKSKMGQLSNYYLADCFLKLDDRISARAAFKKVGSLEYDKAMQEEATFNYGKLSAELGSEREAINVLIGIEEDSPYYDETQEIINDLLVNSSDYANGIKLVESLPRLTDNIKKTYQNLALKKGIQAYGDNNEEQAKLYLGKALKYKQDNLYTAQAYYWQAQIASDNGSYEDSQRLLKQYFELAQNINDFPEESSIYMAEYVQAYNYLKQDNYEDAEFHFKNAIVGMNVDRNNIKNDYILNRILPDAFIRAGDCLFKQKKYDSAIVFYDQSIDREQAGFVYALYQRALIEGLTGEPYKKIITLEKITKDYPDHEYSDDAYFQLGETYLATNNPDQAAGAFSSLTSKYSQKSVYELPSIMKLGLINYNRGNISAAMDYYKLVLNRNPNPTLRTEAMIALEEIYIQDLADAQGFISYMDSIPGFKFGAFTKDSLTYHLGYNLYINTNYDKAILAFDDYLKRFPEGFYRPDALYHRADAYSLQKDYLKAFKDFEELIKIEYNPYFERALDKASLIAYNSVQNFGKALTYYELLREVTFDEEKKYTADLGALRSAFKLAKREKIYKYADLVIANSLATKDEKATAHYYKGKALFNSQKYDQAKKALEDVSRLVSNSKAAESKFLVAEILYRQGKLEESEKQCAYINETSLNYPYWVAKSLILNSDIFIKKGDYLNARAALEAVRDNFKDNEDLYNISIEKLQKLKLIEEKNNRVKNPNSELLELDTNGNK